MPVDCNDPAVLDGSWAYGSAVCKSESLGTSQDVQAAHTAEMKAAGWTGGGWNAYQDALAKKAARGGGGAQQPALSPPAPFPFVQVGAVALAAGAAWYLWRKR